MSSRSNARKSALQILFSYEFELTSVVKDYLEVLCPFVITMGFADQLIEDINLPQDAGQISLENDTQIQSHFKKIETHILEDLQYHYLVQAHIAKAQEDDDAHEEALRMAATAPRAGLWQCGSCQHHPDSYEFICPSCEGPAQIEWQWPIATVLTIDK